MPVGPAGKFASRGSMRGGKEGSIISMTLDSSRETVAVLYDIENAPLEMLSYTLGKAKRYQPCRTIVVSDWDERPEQKRWDKLLRRPGFTFRQINRTYLGKNSLDSALYDSAKLLYDEGVRRYFIITTDSDFVRIAEMLNAQEKSYIIGVGTKQASETLRNAYDEFLVYPPEEKKKKAKKAAKKAAKAEKEAAKAEKEAAKEAKAKMTKQTKDKTEKGAATPARKAKKKPAAKKLTGKAKPQSEVQAKQAADKAARKATVLKKSASKLQTAGKTKTATTATDTVNKKNAPRKKVHPAVAQAAAPAPQLEDNTLQVRLPKTLRQALAARMASEGVSLDELVTFLLMRGLSC